ncbi:MAG: M42 family metallopeptidase [Lentisphaeria bacterium]|nr:M42 family metallopeptidase [Lentisphaeria bacterium]
MIDAKAKKFLEELLMTCGPSGFEFEQAKVYRDYLKPFAHDIRTDVLGNTIARLNPDAEFQFMLSGHYDEIGFQVVNIMPNGLLSFRPVGGIDPLTLPGSSVEILTDEGHVPGVIGRKPIHLQTPEERKAIPKIEDLWIDIGAGSKAHATVMDVQVGDPVVFARNFEMLSDTVIHSKSLDDKIGAFVIAEAFRRLSKRKIKVGVACVGTVQEELGLRGAITGAFGVNPNAAIAVDVGFASDVPGIKPELLGEINLGGGAELQRNADNNPALLSRILNIAQKKKIPYQMTTGHRATGGTDTAAIQMTRGGVATALISIPNRYMHTPAEICDLDDVESAIRLIVETIASLTGEETFIPGID